MKTEKSKIVLPYNLGRKYKIGDFFPIALGEEIIEYEIVGSRLSITGSFITLYMKLTKSYGGS